MTDVPHSVEDFEHYYDSMDIQLDELDVEEIGSHDQPGVDLAHIEGEGRAEDHLRKLAEWRDELWKVLCHFEAELGKIEAWREKQDQKIYRRIAWHERCLSAWFVQTGAKSAQLINGTVRNKAGRERVDITDASAIPQEYLREKVTYDPDRKRILAALKETGEIVPGTEVVRGEDEVVIDTPKPVAP